MYTLQTENILSELLAHISPVQKLVPETMDLFRSMGGTGSCVTWRA